MDLILCHLTADFDTLGAAVGLSRLHPGSRIVLAGDCHPTVRNFLALHRDEYALMERRSLSPGEIRSITVVDTQRRDRLGPLQTWLELGVPITVYDHHLGTDSDIPATEWRIEAVGAAATLVAEALQSSGITLTPIEATVMALGIHVDTGSLTFDQTTARDAAALTWLMEQGATPRVLSEYVEPGLSATLQDLLPEVLQQMHSKTIRGVSLAWVILGLKTRIGGLSSLLSRVMSVAESDIFLLATHYQQADGSVKLGLIGRSRSGGFSTAHLDAIDLGAIFRGLGGGGHPKAAAATINLPPPHPKFLNPTTVVPSGNQSQKDEVQKDEVQEHEGHDVYTMVTNILYQIETQLPPPPTAQTLMSSPVRTIQPHVTIGEAHRILLRYGHSGLSVVDNTGLLVGIISRRDLDIALHHNFSHAPVKGFMSTALKTITPDTPLPEIEDLMVTYDIGRLPVLDNTVLVGIVTRTDLLRQLHQDHTHPPTPPPSHSPTSSPPQRCPLPERMIQQLRDRLVPELWDLLQQVAAQADARGWQLYIVGGAVRDLLLAQPDSPLLLPDIDLVVDGYHRSHDSAAGVELAQGLCDRQPHARIQVHGRFQTAAIIWHNDPVLKSLCLDIATARTEFYPYPAANPEVEASSIRQDLYRRDFTINALSIRLTPPRIGELLDFFGGLIDLEQHQIRVLHANSFIEDPTRIFRAVRFTVRLGFSLEPQTRSYIEHAIASGIYQRIQTEMDTVPALQTRLRRELHYILDAPYWHSAIQLLSELNALQCIHADLHLTPELRWQLRRVHRWLKRFDPNQHHPHWLTLLEVLIAHLDDPAPQSIATKLQLPNDSIQRLSGLKCDRTRLMQALSGEKNGIIPIPNPKSQIPNPKSPSQIVPLLNPHDRSTLILMGATSDRPLRRIIWRYLTQWSLVKPPLDGNDLKALGYKPGKQFKVILEKLLAAKLDGQIQTGEEAKIFLTTTFPLV
ncbi:MAG: CBS domain-containing protein [Cyanothece sp. SIO2G6]|nr:CBS domain-containing protein [Cyanothece sp. SIO2G6]